MHYVLTILEIGSAIFAFASAILWFKSSKIKLPDSQMVTGPAGDGTIFSSDVNSKERSQKSQQQSGLNSKAAFCAGITAGLQFLVYLIGLFVH